MQCNMTKFSSSAPLWLGLVIGNTRYHWGLYAGTSLLQTWHSPHLSAAAAQYLTQGRWDFTACWASLDRRLNVTDKAKLPNEDLRSQLLDQMQARDRDIEIWIASVVPTQTDLWREYSSAHLLSMEEIPLLNTYASLGIDRALALWAAGETYGWPVLAIDAGTALTLTAGSPARELIGGAILPGLSLQRRALAQGTAVLSRYLSTSGTESPCLPQRWALDTATAIESGAIYTTVAGLQDFLLDWWQQFPRSLAILTGGDGHRLHSYLQQRFPQTASRLTHNPTLVLQGIQLCQLNLQR